MAAGPGGLEDGKLGGEGMERERERERRKEEDRKGVRRERTDRSI